jgi:D-alanyl-D-alanine carboxypeptidase/D-alanyl-D-alanine-endopeptidase (penicillin-binding protein 4)
MKKLSHLIPFLAFLLFPAATNAFQTELPKLSQLQNQGALVSAFVVNLNKGSILAQMNSNKRLSPASVSKLVVAASALDTWGGEKTFQSKIYMHGNLSNGTLNGDLIFLGAGDPYLTNEKLWFLTTDVARFGIRKVTGKIIVNNSLFGKVTEDKNRIAKKTHSKNAYDSPLSSAAVNFSVLGIVINPSSKKGNEAHISIEPYDLPSVKIENHVTTSDANSKQKISVERISQDDFDRFIVSGSIPKSGPAVRVYRSVSNADQYAGEVIDAFLNHAQVETSHHIEVQNKSISSQDILVSQVDSFPLSWQLKGLLEMSNNFIADTLLLDLASENESHSNQNLKDAGNLLEQDMKSLLKTSRWASETAQSPLVFESGSGLTPRNQLSSRDLVSLLDHMYFDGNQFAPFLSALPVPGGNGTLKNRFSRDTKKDLKSFLRAKTGTLTDPFDVVSLAGYSRLRNGDWIAFAVLVNGTNSKPSFGVERIRSAIDSDLEGVL